MSKTRTSIDDILEEKKTGKRPGIGHNGAPATVNGVAGERILQYIERVERLEEEKAGLMEDIRDVYAEAKSAGFDTKTLRRVVKARKMDAQKRIEQEELYELYAAAIGLEVGL